MNEELNLEMISSGFAHMQFFIFNHTPVSNIAMENGPFEDVFPIKNEDIPLLC